jgi:16S rRNA (adenine1518-N6/adenine1519-N6)-dimethyltransferase
MAVAAEIDASSTVLEIGPGLGVVTAELVRRAARVVTIELDERLADDLAASLGSPSNLVVVRADALVADFGSFLEEPYVVVASLPYHIATPILFKLVLDRPRPERVVVMLQEEVARRIVPRALPHTYLELAFAVVARARVVQRVPPESFFPVPKVRSAVVRLDLLAEPSVQVDSVRDFLAFIRAGFAQPRQQLHNSLARGLGVAPSAVRVAASSAQLDSASRPGMLGLQEWVALYQAVGPARSALLDA